MRNSYIVYKVKMDYVSKIAFFGLKMMWSRFFLKSLHVGYYFSLCFIKGIFFAHNYKFSNKNKPTSYCIEGLKKKEILDNFSLSFLGPNR